MTIKKIIKTKSCSLTLPFQHCHPENTFFSMKPSIKLFFLVNERKKRAKRTFVYVRSYPYVLSGRDNKQHCECRHIKEGLNTRKANLGKEMIRGTWLFYYPFMLLHIKVTVSQAEHQHQHSKRKLL